MKKPRLALTVLGLALCWPIILSARVWAQGSPAPPAAGTPPATTEAPPVMGIEIPNGAVRMQPSSQFTDAIQSATGEKFSATKIYRWEGETLKNNGDATIRDLLATRLKDAGYVITEIPEIAAASPGWTCYLLERGSQRVVGFMISGKLPAVKLDVVFSEMDSNTPGSEFIDIPISGADVFMAEAAKQEAAGQYQQAARGYKSAGTSYTDASKSAEILHRLVMASVSAQKAAAANQKAAEMTKKAEQAPPPPTPQV